MSGVSRPYPSELLNEVHYYFPALLYDPGRFNTIQDIFNYVQAQMRNHFDLFSNNRNAYLRSEGLNTPRLVRQRNLSPPPAPNRYTNTAPLRAAPPLSVPATPTYNSQQTAPTEDIDTDNSALEGALTPLITNFLASMLNSGGGSLLNPTTYYYTTTFPAPVGWGGGGGQNFMEPVVVRPSAAVLERATTVSVLEANSDNNCAVCQDSMDQGATVRKINSCGHIFHRTCVDTWFQTNVHCPTCRHDVRERVRAAAPQSNADTR
jgi:hypothetical protein